MRVMQRVRIQTSGVRLTVAASSGLALGLIRTGAIQPASLLQS